MCMIDPKAITGLWTLKGNTALQKVDFNFKCPTNAIQNCTGDFEKECDFRQPYCCKLTQTNAYTWKKGGPTSSNFQMCMDAPRKVKVKSLKGVWTDPTKAAEFTYECQETTFDEAASAFDEFFDYAVDFKVGKSSKLKKAGLPYD